MDFRLMLVGKPIEAEVQVVADRPRIDLDVMDSLLPDFIFTKSLEAVLAVANSGSQLMLVNKNG